MRPYVPLQSVIYASGAIQTPQMLELSGELDLSTCLVINLKLAIPYRHRKPGNPRAAWNRDVGRPSRSRREPAGTRA